MTTTKADLAFFALTQMTKTPKPFFCKSGAEKQEEQVASIFANRGTLHAYLKELFKLAQESREKISEEQPRSTGASIDGSENHHSLIPESEKAVVTVKKQEENFSLQVVLDALGGTIRFSKIEKPFSNVTKVPDFRVMTHDQDVKWAIPQLHELLGDRRVVVFTASIEPYSITLREPFPSVLREIEKIKAIPGIEAVFCLTSEYSTTMHTIFKYDHAYGKMQYIADPEKRLLRHLRLTHAHGHDHKEQTISAIFVIHQDKTVQPICVRDVLDQNEIQVDEAIRKIEELPADV